MLQAVFYKATNIDLKSEYIKWLTENWKVCFRNLILNFTNKMTFTITIQELNNDGGFNQYCRHTPDQKFFYY